MNKDEFKNKYMNCTFNRIEPGVGNMDLTFNQMSNLINYSVKGLENIKYKINETNEEFNEIELVNIFKKVNEKDSDNLS